jgi:hypothetical protein
MTRYEYFSLSFLSKSEYFEFFAGAEEVNRRAVSVKLRISICQQRLQAFRTIPVIRQRFIVQFNDPIRIGGDSLRL